MVSVFNVKLNVGGNLSGIFLKEYLCWDKQDKFVKFTYLFVLLTSLAQFVRVESSLGHLVSAK